MDSGVILPTSQVVLSVSAGDVFALVVLLSGAGESELAGSGVAHGLVVRAVFAPPAEAIEHGVRVARGHYPTEIREMSENASAARSSSAVFCKKLWVFMRLRYFGNP